MHSFLKAQNAGDRFDLLSIKLQDYALEHPRIDKAIDISITGTLQELAMAFSKETKLNLTIAPEVNPKVVVNFADTRPRDMLLYFCRYYNLDLSFSGTILTLIPFEEPSAV